MCVEVLDRKLLYHLLGLTGLFEPDVSMIELVTPLKRRAPVSLDSVAVAETLFASVNSSTRTGSVNSPPQDPGKKSRPYH